jgi:predicted RNase H-like HicB family nuclease
LIVKGLRHEKVFGGCRANTDGLFCVFSDLPGCVSTGRNREDVEENMREAIAFHIDWLREEGSEIPQLHTFLSTLSSAFDAK